jgi:4-hydroxy-tetrahydrodipicolinate reductase
VIRVGVIGANGRMGRTVCRAVADDAELSLVAAVDRSGVRTPAGPPSEGPDTEVIVEGDLEAITRAQAQVAVDFTHPDVVMDNVRWLIERHVHAVVGTTGIGPDDHAEIDRLLEKEGGRSNVLVAPNFAIGAVLAERFAAQAARYFPAAEVIELHHDQKADAPSGTSLSAARRVVAERANEYRGPDRETLQGSRGGDLEGVRVHSIRLPGLLAHQEIILGGPGQVLTIRHDSMDRSSFMAGVLLAIRAVGDRPGLTVGLDSLLS